MFPLWCLAPERKRAVLTLDPDLKWLQVLPGTTERSECNGSESSKYQ